VDFFASGGPGALKSGRSFVECKGDLTIVPAIFFTVTLKRRVLMMCTNTGRRRLVASLAVLLPVAATSHTHAVTVMRDPIQGAGFVEVAGGTPLILGAPVSSPLDVDIVFTDMRHIELMNGASTTVEFGIGNTGNTADLDYRIVFDLSDMSGNLITNEALVVQNTAPAGFIQIVNLDLTPLPPVIFHDMHVRVEASFDGANTGSGLFDLYIAGGAGDVGTGVSGPIRFNRAIVGEWIPEPAAAALAIIALAGLMIQHRHRW
jgi:hypothetical protein